jgi:hypothetical protein
MHRPMKNVARRTSTGTAGVPDPRAERRPGVASIAGTALGNEAMQPVGPPILDADSAPIERRRDHRLLRENDTRWEPELPSAGVDYMYVVIYTHAQSLPDPQP